SAVLRIAEGAHQVLDPRLFDRRVVGDIGVVRIVAGDVGAVGVNAVSPVGVIRIGGLLGAILGDGKATKVGAAGPELCSPVKQIEGDAGLGAAGAGAGNEGVL